MKTLIIVRHAKSSWDYPGLSDFDRPLNTRGERDAPRMGKRLKEKDLSPDMLVSSPARRAIDTCEIIARAIGYPKESIVRDKRIYHADEEQLLSLVRHFDDKVAQVLLFGHNPGLTDFANSLTNAQIDNIPTCGIVACRFQSDQWTDIKWGTGKLWFFDYPKKKD